MKNLFESFKNSNQVVSSSDAYLGISVEFNGSLNITKGQLTENISFYARTYKMSFANGGNYISIDEWHINDTASVSFNGLPIDDIEKLKTTLNNSGLSTLANSLEIEHKEREIEIAKQIQGSKLFKTIYGKDAVMWNALDKQDQHFKKLEEALINYDNISIHTYVVKDYLKEDEGGNKVIPTKEELEYILNNLKTS